MNMLHSLDEQWLRSRVRGWMEMEAQGFDFWLGTHTADGKWIFCASRDDSFRPRDAKQKYAVDVSLHLNHACSCGGAWLVGWIDTTFYLLWKDAQGDIQIPIECNKPWIVLRDWKPDAWEKHAMTALHTFWEFHRNMEYAEGQTKNVAQGESLVVH